ncbi:hypothetical protein GQ457_05G016100 [Hibiscus cannabinus]
MGQASNFAYKLLCPRFDGEDFRGWMSKLEQYFEAENVPEAAKIRVVMLHLEGKALQWHQFLSRTQRDFHQLNWDQYANLLRERFCPGGLEDPFSELLALKQNESVEQFYEEFIHLLNQPQHIQDTRNQSTRGAGKVISPAEIEERRKKGLCFWCAAKYTPGHKCPRSQLFQISVEGVDEEGETEVFLDCEDGGELINRENGRADSPTLSLQAMWGASSWETMKLQMKIGEVSCIALLDSGSSHNFMSWALVKKIGMGMSQRTQFKVMVADGNTLGTMGECKAVRWESQGHIFTTDFLVLPLKHCEMVLEVQWFAELGAIKWNFNEMSMEFPLEGINIKLLGHKTGNLEMMNSKLCSKLVKSSNSPFTGSLLYVNTQLEIKGKGQPSEELRRLLNRYEDVFEEPKGLPPARGHDHRIKLLDEQAVVKARPYRYPASQKDEIEKLIKEMLENGVIRDSNSAFSSPIVIVKKKDDSWRMCVDYRRLNQLTVKDKFPMPIIEELLDELGKARVFSKLDLRSGYHQIRMSEPDIHKTAFRTHEGHYEFLVMPFGLTNAPATFQGLMNKVFKGLLRRSVLVFFDDILIYSANWELHCQHLEEVLQILRENSLYAKLSKCCFGAQEVDYLGYVIAGGEIAMDKGKVECILNWPAPKNIKELRGFLGLSGYYRRFIKGYGVIARSLTDLLKKGGWKWDWEEEQAFQKLKEAVSQAPVLVLPDFKKVFTVETDASEMGVGAVLSQKGKPLAFFSRGLGVRHQGLSVYEKEMMAVLMAVKKWSPYLIGRHFKIKTDHQSLKFLAENQAITPSQQKWVVKMMGYDYEVQYRKGINNIVADVLSRKPAVVECNSLTVSKVSTEVMARVEKTWQDDETLKKLIEKEALELNSGDPDPDGDYVFGLGYDISTDDYKGERGIFLHGALHWLARRPSDPDKILVIVAFDMAEEKFYQLVQLPDAIEKAKHLRRMVLTISADSLCLFCGGGDLFPTHLELDVWKLIGSSWTRIFSENRCTIPTETCWGDALYYTKSGKIVLDYLRCCLMWYDPKENTCETYNLKDDREGYKLVMYTESLILPDWRHATVA